MPARAVDTGQAATGSPCSNQMARWRSTSTTSRRCGNSAGAPGRDRAARASSKARAAKAGSRSIGHGLHCATAGAAEQARSSSQRRLAPGAEGGRRIEPVRRFLRRFGDVVRPHVAEAAPEGLQADFRQHFRLHRIGEARGVVVRASSADGDAGSFISKADAAPGATSATASAARERHHSGRMVFPRVSWLPQADSGRQFNPQCLTMPWPKTPRQSCHRRPPSISRFRGRRRAARS